MKFKNGGYPFQKSITIIIITDGHETVSYVFGEGCARSVLGDVLHHNQCVFSTKAELLIIMNTFWCLASKFE